MFRDSLANVRGEGDHKQKMILTHIRDMSSSNPGVDTASNVILCRFLPFHQTFPWMES